MKNTYIHKLQILSVQALNEGKAYVSDFLNNLIQKENSTELLDYIYKSTDDLNEDLVTTYNYLLENNMPLEWYTIASFINDERESIGLYHPVIKECIENNIDIIQFQNLLYDCNFIDEFCELVKEILPKKENPVCSDSVTGEEEIVTFPEYQNSSENEAGMMLEQVENSMDLKHKDIQFIYDIQNRMNKLVTQCQVILTEISASTIEMVQNWESDRNQISQMTLYCEIEKKLFLQQQAKMKEKDNEIVYLKMKLEEAENSLKKSEEFNKKAKALLELYEG